MWEREPDCTDVLKSGTLRVYELTCFGDMRRCVAKIEKRMRIDMVENESCSTTNNEEQNGERIMLTPIEQHSKSTLGTIFLQVIIHHCTASMDRNPRITSRPPFFESPLRFHEWISQTWQSFHRRAIPPEFHPCLARAFRTQ